MMYYYARPPLRCFLILNFVTFFVGGLVAGRDLRGDPPFFVGDVGLPRRGVRHVELLAPPIFRRQA
jgi:hypothetical protein